MLVPVFALLASVAAANVVELTPSTFDEVVDGSKNVIVAYVAPWCGHCKNLHPEWDELGAVYNKKATDTVVARVDADAHKDLGSKAGVTGFPTIKYFPKGATTASETYSGARTAQDIADYLNKMTGNNIRIPKAPEAVVMVTDDNFDDIVLDSKKDALVAFTAPWCGHCKRLVPDYEKLAKTFADEEGVVIAKVDADEHKAKASKYGVSGYPTIKWFPKDNKEGVDYTGGRSAEDFVKFINEKTGTLRKVGGGLLPEAGRVAALDEIAKEYGSSSDKAALLAKAEEIIKGLEGAKAAEANYYVKVMKKIDEKPTFAKDEGARLKRMLEGTVTGKKSTEFSKRINVLAAFE